jgi:6-phosphogluconolactonase
MTAAVFGGLFMAAPASAATFVYVGNAGSNNIYVLSLDAKSGDLTMIEKVDVPGIKAAGGSTPLAVSPDKKFLVAGLRGDPKVAATFKIDRKTGKLTHVGSGPLADSMPYIAHDRTGKFLLSASYGGNKVSVNPIGPDGVAQAPKQIIDTEPNAHEIMPSADNRFVLATSLGGDLVRQFKFDAKSGTLTLNDPPSVSVKAKSGPRHFRWSKDGKTVYLLCELDSSLFAFDYDAKKGTLKQKQEVDTMPAGYSGKRWAADLHLTPDGKFLYTSERGNDTLVAYKVDRASGKVSLIDRYPTETQPRGFAIDPAGRYLLAVGEKSNGMSSYKIDAKTGVLTKLKSYPMDKSPNWVEIVNLP